MNQMRVNFEYNGVKFFEVWQYPMTEEVMHKAIEMSMRYIDRVLADQQQTKSVHETTQLP